MDKIEVLKKIIEKANNIVFFGGAGVSTESNIPDFRSDNGIYKKNNYPYPAEVMLSRDFYDFNKKAFYDFYFKEMIYKDAKPNNAHYALSKLEECGKLKAIITQNIDGLHQDAGSKKVIELHGSIKRNYCIKCHSFYNLDAFLKNEGICPKCGSYIKPDVVLYGEALNEEDIKKAIDYISKADTLIVGGTSLSVYPAAGFIKYFKGQNLILINKSSTPYDDVATLVIHKPIGEVLSYLLKKA